MKSPLLLTNYKNSPMEPPKFMKHVKKLSSPVLLFCSTNNVKSLKLETFLINLYPEFNTEWIFVSTYFKVLPYLWDPCTEKYCVLGCL